MVATFSTQLGIDINDYVVGFEVTMRNLVLVQKRHAFNELKTKRHSVVGNGYE